VSISRRSFLKAGLSSLTYFSTAATVPVWIAQTAKAFTGLGHPDRVLVIIQQAGGNDGLNTVIPYTDPIYTGQVLVGGQEQRPNLKILEPNLGLTLLGDGLNAFHPKLIRLKDWYTNGNVSVIQNVGYPNPNLSHFVATDLWEYGTSPGSQLSTLQGWVSRFFDNQCAGIPPENIDPLTMLGAGDDIVPLTLNGSLGYTPPSVLNFSSYKFDAPTNATLNAHHKQGLIDVNTFATADPTIDFLQRSANVAQASVDDVATANLQPTINPYPAGSLGNGLDIVSKIIRAGFTTKIFYVTQGGYDTHANQIAGGDPINGGDHPQLLDEFDQAVDAFMKDMEQSGFLEKVMVMTFSEFGRRIKENGSLGTDHGAANSLFLLGGDVNRGVYGGQPDLGNLLNGNLRHTIDFRAVYSTIIQDWFGADPEPIFGSIDFNDPIFNIQGGMAMLPVINNAPSIPATTSIGNVAGAALTLAAGVYALRRIDHAFAKE